MAYSRDKIQKRGHVKWMMLSVAGTLCVLCLTHIPQANIKVGLTLFKYDKVIHALAYGVLAFLYVMSVGSQGNGLVLIGIVMILGSLAGLDEFTQSFVGRSSDAMDFGADILGIGIVVLSRRLWQQRRVCELFFMRLQFDGRAHGDDQFGSYRSGTGRAGEVGIHTVRNDL